MLNWNANKVKNLSGAELWMFIVARVLAGFGLGAVAVHNWPRLFWPIAVPSLALGLVLFLVAAKGLFRENAE